MTLQPGEELILGKRLREILKQAGRNRKRPHQAGAGGYNRLRRIMRRRGLAAGIAALLAGTVGFAQEVEFNRDIRPILSDKCYTCHGPDKANRKTKLRFDTEDGAKQDLGGHFAIVPGDPAKSETGAAHHGGPSRRCACRRSGPAYKLTDARDRSHPRAGSSRARSGRSTGRSFRRSAAQLPEVKDRDWPRNADRRFRAGAARAGRARRPRPKPTASG